MLLYVAACANNVCHSHCLYWLNFFCTGDVPQLIMHSRFDSSWRGSRNAGCLVWCTSAKCWPSNHIHQSGSRPPYTITNSLVIGRLLFNFFAIDLAFLSPLHACFLLMLDCNKVVLIKKLLFASLWVHMWWNQCQEVKARHWVYKIWSNKQVSN